MLDTIIQHNILVCWTPSYNTVYWYVGHHHTLTKTSNTKQLEVKTNGTSFFGVAEIVTDIKTWNSERNIDEYYSRNVSCALNLISTFLLYNIELHVYVIMELPSPRIHCCWMHIDLLINI